MSDVSSHLTTQYNELIRVLPDHTSTLALGAALARGCDRQITLYLVGELGAGKTTFCRGFLEALGHRGSVKSPTYTLVESYLLPPFHVYHFDLYRLTEPEALELIGIRDYQHANAVALIEWPQLGIGYLPPADLTLQICYQLSGRLATLQAASQQGHRLLQKLAGSVG